MSKKMSDNVKNLFVCLFVYFAIKVAKVVLKILTKMYKTRNQHYYIYI